MPDNCIVDVCTGGSANVAIIESRIVEAAFVAKKNVVDSWLEVMVGQPELHTT